MSDLQSGTRSLTPRQRQVFVEALRGKAEKAIAGTLGISPQTTHQYMKRVYAAFGVTSRAELLALVISYQAAVIGEMSDAVGRPGRVLPEVTLALVGPPDREKPE